MNQIDDYNSLLNKIDRNLIRKFPENWCLNKMTLPVHQSDTGVMSIITNTNDQNHINEIHKYTKCKSVEILQKEENFIKQIISDVYHSDKDWDIFLKNNLSLDSSSVETIIERLLIDAVKSNASDIHIFPFSTKVSFKYRICGKMKEIFSCEKVYYQKIVVYLKIMFGVDITSSFRHRDGATSKNILGVNINMRISFHRCVDGEKIAIRLINNVQSLGLHKLGYSEFVYNSIKRILRSNFGIFCFVGPTGSGKTTSLYSCLREIDLNLVNVMSVEDPVEVYLDNITQTDVNSHPDMNFVECLKSVMRQDPDIIVIGEIRDKETAEMTLRASMSGHKVFTTFHSYDAISAIDRLCEFGLNRRSVIDNMCGVVAQRILVNDDKRINMISEVLCFDKYSRSILYDDSLGDDVFSKLSNIGYSRIFEDGMKLVNKGIIRKMQLEEILDEDK